MDHYLLPNSWRILTEILWAQWCNWNRQMWRSTGQIKGELYWNKCYKKLWEIILLSSLVPDSFIILLGPESIVQQLISGFLLHFVSVLLWKKNFKNPTNNFKQFCVGFCAYQNIFLMEIFFGKAVLACCKSILNKNIQAALFTMPFAWRVQLVFNLFYFKSLFPNVPFCPVDM